jgi:type I restriction enzyme S subunit
MKHISQAKLLGIRTILPPIEGQRSFCKRIAAVHDLHDSHVDSLSTLDGLFSSLQHRAFRGEL